MDTLTPQQLHQENRIRIWSETLSRFIVRTPVISEAQAVEVADKALRAFDRKFPEPRE